MQPSTLDNAMDVTNEDEEFQQPWLEDGALALGYQGWAAKHLLLASHRIFASVENGTLEDNDLVSLSLDHRGILYWCLSNVNADVVGEAASEEELREEDAFHDGLTDFYHVWTLAEAFLLDSAPLPAAPLLRWLKMYTQSGEDEAARLEIDETEEHALAADAQGGSAELTPAYWRAVRSLVVTVMPRRAAQLLRAHPEGRDSAGEVGALVGQLQKMPLLLPVREQDGGGDGAAEAQLDRESFFETWSRWQKGCKVVAASFGVVPGISDAGRSDAVDGGSDANRQQLTWLWGVLCGVRGCLEEATSTWAGLFSAVLAFERPDVRKEEMAPLLRECDRKYRCHEAEEFLQNVIRDASVGAVVAILRFAGEQGDTLALSACAAHLVDLLFKAKIPSVTVQQRSWFLSRFARFLKASPCGGWEMAATYILAADRKGEQALKELTRMVMPQSERAAHELVEWCGVNRLGREAEVAVCRARGFSWIGKTAFQPEAFSLPARSDDDRSTPSPREPGACGKAAYWLARGGARVHLERLCAEVSELLMVEVVPDLDADLEIQRDVLEEAESVLQAIPGEIEGPEQSFLERYKCIADHLFAESEALQHRADPSPGPNARRAGVLAVVLLTSTEDQAIATASATSVYTPSRAWAHLLRIALPALRDPVGPSATTALHTHVADMGQVHDQVTAPQVHGLLAKLQQLLASEHRVGSQCGNRPSTLPLAPAPYRFSSREDSVFEIRTALASALARTMMAPRRNEVPLAEYPRASLHAERLSADALAVPRVSVGL